MVDGQLNLRDAVRRHDHLHEPRDGKKYKLNAKTAVLLRRSARAAGTSPERHMLVDGAADLRALIFGISAWSSSTTPKSRWRASTGPYFYLPKDGKPSRGGGCGTTSSCDAQKAGRRFRAAPSRPRCLIETLPAAFEMDEIAYELARNSLAPAQELNCAAVPLGLHLQDFIKKSRGRGPRLFCRTARQVSRDGQGLPARLRRSCSSRRATGAASTRWAGWRRRSRSRTIPRPTRPLSTKVRGRQAARR